MFYDMCSIGLQTGQGKNRKLMKFGSYTFMPGCYANTGWSYF